MRFIADAMLGKFARWLRILGQDVTYFTGLSDDVLLGLTKREDRVLLTRDFELYRRAFTQGLEAFFVVGETEPKRLAEVANRYNLRLTVNMDRANCPLCNTSLESVSKKQLKDKLKENTYRYYEKFWVCPSCGQIYWIGSHWKQIENTLREAEAEQCDKLRNHRKVKM